MNAGDLKSTNPTPTHKSPPLPPRPDTPPPTSQLAREVCLHMRSCHPSITSLYAAYKDARYIYLLMELAPSGNLYQMLMSMPVPPVRRCRVLCVSSILCVGMVCVDT